MSSDIVASKRRPPTVLQDEQIRTLISGCSNRAPTGIRNRALIAVMWRCGLRIAEALALGRSTRKVVNLLRVMLAPWVGETS
jgi:site-specific recombinase XerD